MPKYEVHRLTGDDDRSLGVITTDSAGVLLSFQADYEDTWDGEYDWEISQGYTIDVLAGTHRRDAFVRSPGMSDPRNR